MVRRPVRRGTSIIDPGPLAEDLARAVGFVNEVFGLAMPKRFDALGT
jgi:hypothetical protein